MELIRSKNVTQGRQVGEYLVAGSITSHQSVLYLIAFSINLPEECLSCVTLSLSRT